MKKFLLLLCVMFLSTAGAQAQNWDTTPDANGKYDGQFDRPTHFPDWSQPTTWPNNMFYLCEVKIGNRQLANYEIAVYDQDNVLRHCCRSKHEDNEHCVLTIMGTEGDTFRFEVVYGDFENPTITKVPDITVPFYTNNIVGNDKPFLLQLPGRFVITDADTELPGDMTAVDVTLERSFKANEWNTICLPFAMNAEQLTKAFGSDVKVGDFMGCKTTYADDEETVVAISVHFETVTSLEANHPYVIRMSKALTSFDVDGVDFHAEAEPSVDRDMLKVKKNVYLYNSFVGNYETNFFVPDQCLFLSDSNFWYSTGISSLKPFRAYFDFYDVLPIAEESESRITMSFDDDEEETTGIDELRGKMEDGRGELYFNLQGCPVSTPKKGLYIKNGKKVLIK